MAEMDVCTGSPFSLNASFKIITNLHSHRSLPHIEPSPIELSPSVRELGV
jgi:hypothetical protein